MLGDEFDPRFWAPDPEVKRVYVGRNAEHVCVVDADDYDEVIKRKWWLNKAGRDNPDHDGQGYVRGSVGKYKEEYLHVWLMRNIPKPTFHHLFVDHANGDRLDNRKANLKWVTYQENRANRNGYYFILANHPQLELAV
jgi:hypothetical protein